jgi:hypothetical protein
MLDVIISSRGNHCNVYSRSLQSSWNWWGLNKKRWVEGAHSRAQMTITKCRLGPVVASNIYLHMEGCMGAMAVSYTCRQRKH